MGEETRELNCRVAVELFGWIKWKRTSGSQAGLFWLAPPNPAESGTPLFVRATDDDPPHPEADFHVPAYSAGWAGAGLVVEWLRAQPWYRGFSVTDAATQGGAYTAEVWGKIEGVTERIGVEYTADTAAKAICLAALAAVAAEKGRGT